MRAITPMSVDDISVLDDRELNIRFRDVSRAIRKVKGQNRTSLEIEYCYLYREREIRENRAKAHYEYTKQQRDGNSQNSSNNNSIKE